MIHQLDHFEVKCMDENLTETWVSCMAYDFGHAQELIEELHPGLRIVQITLIKLRSICD